ncbi:unnamed protein product [Ascophyllum nodosum]
MSDRREDFVVDVIASLTGEVRKITRDEVMRDIRGEKELELFLDDPNTPVLCVRSLRGGGFHLENSIGVPASADGVCQMHALKGESEDVTPASGAYTNAVGLHFVKLRPEPITGENVRKLVQQVSSMSGSALNSLYHSVHSVYAPALLKNEAGRKELSGKVQSAIALLDSTLGDAVIYGGGGQESQGLTSSSRQDGDLQAFGGIVFPSDEFQFWLGYSGRGADRELVSDVARAFEPLCEPFARLSSLQMEELEELMDLTHTALDEAWKADAGGGTRGSFPQARMAHLFDVIGAAFCRHVQEKLQPLDLWGGTLSEVSIRLLEGIQVCSRWCRVAEELTSSYWPGFIQHPWKGDPHTDHLTAGMATRLEEIHRLRTTREELVRLLGRSGAIGAVDNSTKIFESFRTLMSLRYNPYTLQEWRSRVKVFEQSLRPLEMAAANSFRRRITGMESRPQLLLKEFHRFSNLMRRRQIQEALGSEREALLSQLTEHMAVQEMIFDDQDLSAGVDPSGSGSGLAWGRNLSSRIRGIVYCRQLCARVRASAEAASALLSDLSGFRAFEEISGELVTKTRRREASLFQDWQDEVEDGLESGELSAQMRGKLMDIDKKGILVVNYSERLVTLLREVRQLSELGHTIPSKILKVTNEGEAYYRYGVMLKKVANFYNNMASQVIPEQKPMLLDSLLAFEEVVMQPTLARKGRHGSNGGSVTWSNPVECENYVERLQRAADALSSDNRRLRKVHASMASLVSSIMSIDLLRQRDRWKTQWTRIRELVTGLEAKYPVSSMKQWVTYWDHQMYKALEAGYQMGLESLNENLSEMRAELTFAHRVLQFKPPLEELRAAYYRDIKKFVSIPSNFDGFGNSKVYKKMTTMNSQSLLRVYEKAEGIFQRLAVLLDTYKGWMVLGQADLDGFVDSHVNTTVEFEENFKAIKSKRKEADKLPDVIKIDCITVSLFQFKVCIEDQLQRLVDVLTLALRNSVLSNFKAVDLYLEDSMEKLGRRPRTIEDIGEAKRDWKEVESKKEEMKSLSNKCTGLKTLLLQHAPGNQVDASEAISKMADLNGEGGRWDEFEVAAEAFQEMVEEQKESLKSVLEEEVIQLNQTLEKFGQRWRALKPQEMKDWSALEVDRVFAALIDWREQFQEHKSKVNAVKDYCVSFGMPSPRLEGVDPIEEDLTTTESSWALFKEYSSELKVLADQDWISFRSNVFALQDLATKWIEKIKARLAEAQRADIVTAHINEELERIRKATPALKYCRGEPFKEEHWSALLQGKLGLDRGVSLENLTVGHFISVLDRLADPALLQFVKHLQSRAQGEVTIREALQELVAWSQTAELKLVDHGKSNKKTPLIRDWNDVFLELGDKQSLLASLKESQFFKMFEDQGITYEVKLGTLDYALHTLNQIQRKWVYLEPIFGMGALPAEQGRFRRVEEEFRDIMAKVEIDRRLFSLADEQLFPDLRGQLSTSLDQLERCQKALSDFLEEKRSAMPRFYFIGDEDLLEILGQAKNPTVIQAHLKKLFQGIHSVEFNEQDTKITAMISACGEKVPLNSPVPVSDRVEEWLENLNSEMKNTLTSLLQECLRGQVDYERYPSQLLCLAEQIKFCDHVEIAVSQGNAGELMAPLRELLEQYTAYDLSSRPLMQLKIKALVLDLVHSIDIVDQLQKSGVESLKDWTWQKQLRFYLKSGSAVVQMSSARFVYSYEYQGNAPKLVHTPLTDKCYLTLTQGMHMGFGGNPYGPAGTGKTESVKALGQAFGRQVLVFNCDEGIDFQSMGRIFIGLVKCGAWGCFDEFNRLKEDQLSAISQQIQLIQDAIKAKRPSLKLLGREINVDLNAGIFVTLNPAGKKYGGRSKLPDNLKALFRPVAMGRPDNELIAEVILNSEGFTDAKDLASKIVSMFTLSKQLLSRQQHYDWGLRALKAVLNTGGNLIQAAKRDGERINAAGERELLIKAVRVNTLSKLTYSDTRLFLALIGDVFPGAKSSDIPGGELEEAIREVMAAKPFFLEVNDTQVRKMLQLKEALDQRMGCVIVGPSGCGKSTLWSILRNSMIKCGQAVNTHVVNPKSMPRQRLLGHMDLDTREWFDGVLTAAARKVVKESHEVKSWLVCDGDVDPEWIESLNSVLDDNHLLTLPNGERINFGSNVNFVFETHDLKFASPATVSRMGMIFLSDEDVDVKRLLTRWLNTQPKEQRPHLSGWVDDMFFRGLDYVLDRDMVVDTTLVGTVLNGLSQVAGSTSKAEFACGVIRGLGGNLRLPERSAFAREVFQWAQERPPDISCPLNCYSDRGVLVPYPVAPFDTGLRDPDGKSGSGIGPSTVVPTVSVQRALTMMEPWITNSEPFILVGPEGCGKDMIIRHAFSEGALRPGARGTGGLKRVKTSITVLHCNARTTAENVITKASTSALFSAPDGRVFRPRDCERLVLYLKDINLPRPDKYNTCMLIAFLQQLQTFGGFYDENLEFLRLERVHLVASMNAATTVGRHPLSSRFTATVRIGVLDYPDESELCSVYSTFLGKALGGRSSDSRQEWDRASERDKLSKTMVDLYEQVKGKFSVDEHRHYLLTPRDLTAWVRGLLRYELESENVLDCIAYEAHRLFSDRLVDSKQRARFDGMLKAQLRSSWGHTADLVGVSFTTLGEGVRHAGTTPGEDGREGGGVEKSLKRLNQEELKDVVEQALIYFEREERDLQMLLFPEVLDQIAWVDRVLSDPGGHLLLVGRSGVGRREATVLAAYMQGSVIFTPAVTRGFGLAQLEVVFKAAMQSAGVEGHPSVLLLEDHHLTTDDILETVNSLLSGGEVPGLHSPEELEPLLAPLKEQMREDGHHKTTYDFFVSRVQRNLHVALCMDPTNPRFAVRCESNPALYNRCACLWFGKWRPSTLRLVPGMIDGVRDMIQDKDTEQEDKGKMIQLQESKGGYGFDVAEEKNEEGNSSLDAKGSGDGRRSGRRRNDWTVRGTRHARGPVGDALVDKIVQMHESWTERTGEEADAPAGARCGTGRGPSTTPKEYVSFLMSWFEMHEVKQGSLKEELGHLTAGLSKLEEASSTVDDLSRNAAKKQKELQAAQVAADSAMDQITSALSEASARKNETERLKQDLAVNEKATQSRKGDIEEELSSIQPVLDSAKKAVGQIKSDHINEIRSLKMPPEPIADVLGAVLMLLGIRDTSWLSMKKFLGNRGVKEEILNFDAHRIDPQLRAQVSKLLHQKSTSFEQATIYRVSVAAAPLATWVKANIKYSLILEKIRPLEEELEEAVVALDKSQARLTQCEDELAAIDRRASELKEEFARRTREAETLRSGLERAQGILTKAQRLILQLGGERKRWQDQATSLTEALATLPLKMLLAAGFATYLVKYPENTRKAMMERWAESLGLPSGFSFRRLMSTESQLLVWKSEGLPADDLISNLKTFERFLGQENALVLASDPRRVPFVVDPANACTTWLKTFLAKDARRPLEVVSVADSRFSSKVELSVRFGKTLLVLECEGVEPMLYPLARKDLVHQGPRYVVQVGDKLMDYNENFRLFMVTRNPNPELPPDACALVCEVNFTTTRRVHAFCSCHMSGLEGQLLGVTIQHEQPELEKAKSEMLREEEGFKVRLADLEKALLDALATAEGDLLEDASLIERLSETKATAAEIQVSLEKSAKASEELDRQRDVYRDFAKAGSTLFFLVDAMKALCPMYKSSLASFVRLFQAALSDQTNQSGLLASDSGHWRPTRVSDSASAVEERLARLTPALQVRVLYFVGRSLLKEDRPTFALHMIHGMHPELFQENEWEVFTGQLGSATGVSETGRPRGCPPWASTDRAQAFSLLAEHLPLLVKTADLSDVERWQRWATSAECERDFPPIRSISLFQRVLLVQALRPDRLQSALHRFANEVLRVSSLSPSAQSLEHLYKQESSANIPILLITTSGADPGKEMEELAENTVGRVRWYQEIAMGEGQQVVAIAMLPGMANSANNNGDWVCLKNLHLVVAWLPSLEKELSSLEPHPDFRLWLTTEPHDEFPPLLLQQSLKVTFESPPGLKNNIQRTYSTWPTAMVEGNEVKAQLLFALAWFHGVVQERRTFIPQGWTKEYDFSVGDLRRVCNAICSHIPVFEAGSMVMAAEAGKTKNGNVDWRTVRGLMVDAIYGGRVDNPQDMRVLETYLRRYFNSDVIGGAGNGGKISTGITIPGTDKLQDYVDAVQKLPDADHPSVFGLPDNIERSVQRTASSLVVTGLRRLGAAAVVGETFDREMWRSRLGPLLEAWDKLASSIGSLSDSGSGSAGRRGSRRSSRTPESGGKSLQPVDAFVQLETESAAELLAVVSASLGALRKVVYGTALLTPAIQATGGALTAGKVPPDWSSSWEGPVTPQAWLTAMARRKASLSRWEAAVARGDLLDHPIDLSNLFHPNTFLNAVRQQTARLSGCSIDALKLVSSWDKGRLKSAVLPVTIEGLRLQGAAFSGGTLHAQSTNDPEVAGVPDVTLAYVQKDKPWPYQVGQAIDIPLYLSLDREHFLAEVSMPTSEPQDTWILAGVSLFLKG